MIAIKRKVKKKNTNSEMKCTKFYDFSTFSLSLSLSLWCGDKGKRKCKIILNRKHEPVNFRSYIINHFPKMANDDDVRVFVLYILSHDDDDDDRKQ